ncbi:MAG: helix-turn-helix domain-containing protein [Gemmatimonadaceae bacterium]
MAARGGAVRKASAKSARKPVVRESSGNVFADLGFEEDEAEHLRIRSALVATLRKVMAERELTQVAAAKLLEVSQPRVSDLVRGKISAFSIDALVDMLARVGIRVDVRMTALIR